MEEELFNQRCITLLQKIKTRVLKFKYGSRLETNGPIRILGTIPVLKMPGKSKIKLGKKVVLNSDDNHSNTALTYRCTLVCGLNGEILVGDNTMMNGVSITAYEKVSIGENCQIASATLISDTDFHPINPAIRQKEAMGYRFDHNLVNKRQIIIGNNVWIGWGVIILKGVTIGDNSIIAAGAVVVNDVPSNVIAAGNPAKVVKSI